MHLQIDEQLDLWQTVQAVKLDQPEVSDNAFQDIDDHFAEVQSWHVELRDPNIDAQQVSVAAAGRRAPASNGHSTPVPLRRANGKAAKVHSDQTQALRKQLAAERELHTQLAEQLAAEHQELLVFQETIKQREEQLDAALQMMVAERGELQQRRTETEERESELLTQQESWRRDVAERERTLECREQTLSDEQQSLNELRCRLEAQATWLEQEASRLEAARAELEQQRATFESEPVPAEVVSTEVAPAASHVGERDLDAVDAPTDESSEASAQDEDRDQGDTSSRFEHMSLESLTEEDEGFDSMIDRIVLFHHEKTRKWYMFWR